MAHFPYQKYHCAGYIVPFGFIVISFQHNFMAFEHVIILFQRNFMAFGNAILAFGNAIL